MAYEKKEWYSGETITASKLNRIENGIDDLDKGTTNLTNNLNSEIQTRATETATLTNNLNSEIQTRTSEANTLKSRVDQIVAPTGEAPNPSEITDARVGADGKTYDSLGNAIRTQVTDLKSALQDIGVEASSTAISVSRTIGYTINGTGAIVTSGNNYVIYKASVTPGKTYFVTASQNWSALYYAYYDASMELVQVGTSSAVGSAVTRIEKEKTVAPTGAAYLVSTSVNEVITDPISEFNGYYVLPRLDTVISDVSGLMHGVPIKNLFNPSKVLPGYYFNGSGTLIDNANSAYDDEYISVDPTEKYIANADGLQIVAYAADKTFIERAYHQEAAETYFTFNSNVAFVRVSRYGSAFPSNFIFATVKTYEFINGTSGDYVGSVTKTPTSLIVTTEKLKVIINKYNDSGIRAYNVWRANDAFICDENNVFQRLWYNSDSDGVVKLKDEDDFIGGYHGDETQTGFHLFVDGVEYSENSSFTDLTFDEIMLYCESDVYHCNTSNTPDVVAFKRNKIITFNKDGYSVSNYWVAQEGVTVVRAYMGMLSVERFTDQTFTDYLLTGYHTNHNYAYVDSDTGTGANPDITEVVFNTIYGDVGIEIKDVKTPGTYYADVTNFNSAYDKRLKAYLAPINSNNGVSVSAGAVIKAKSTIFVR